MLSVPKQNAVVVYIRLDYLRACRLSHRQRHQWAFKLAITEFEVAVNCRASMDHSGSTTRRPSSRKMSCTLKARRIRDKRAGRLVVVFRRRGTHKDGDMIQTKRSKLPCGLEYCGLCGPFNSEKRRSRAIMHMQLTAARNGSRGDREKHTWSLAPTKGPEDAGYRAARGFAKTYCSTIIPIRPALSGQGLSFTSAERQTSDR